MKYYIIIIILFSLLHVHAKPIDANTAKKIALTVIKSKSSNDFVVKNVIENRENGIITTYLVDFIKNGWVLVSADDRTVPIFAYSTTSKFEINDLSPTMRDWLRHFNESVYDVIKTNNQRKRVKYKWNKILNENIEKTEKAVEPLLKTFWGQSASNDGGVCHAYNYNVGKTNENCSCLGDKHCPAGCVAVAVGQIMRYWAHPYKVGNHYFDWCNMPVSLLYYDNPNYITHRNEIARLLKSIGFRVLMVYCQFGECQSGATSFMAKKALVTQFNYDNSADLDRRYFFSDKRWKTKLKNDLDKGMPVYYSGSYEDGSGKSGGGHAFVCDGYTSLNDDDFFSFNLGWRDGSGEYFYIDSISSYMFNLRQDAIFKIKPDENEQIDCQKTINVKQWYSWTWGYQDYFYKPAGGTINSTISDTQIEIYGDEEVNYTATNRISLKNFKIESGAKFRAKLIDCPDDCRHASSNAGKEVILDNNSIEETTDINEFFQTNNMFSLFPNPTSQTVTLEINSKGIESVVCSVKDISGKVFYNKQLNVSSRFFKTEINISKFPRGIYFVNITGLNFSETKKLIVQ